MGRDELKIVIDTSGVSVREKLKADMSGLILSKCVEGALKS
jgi:hypothetical protein